MTGSGGHLARSWKEATALLYYYYFDMYCTKLYPILSNNYGYDP